jgi:hypothetical protein
MTAARVSIPVTLADRSGVVLPAAAPGDATNFNSVVNSGTTLLIVKNTGVTSRTLTVHLDRTVDGFAAAPRTKTLAAGETQVFGPFSVADYGPILHVDVDNAELTIQPVRI